MKKLLVLGTLVTTITPIVGVISCGKNTNLTEPDEIFKSSRTFNLKEVLNAFKNNDNIKVLNNNEILSFDQWNESKLSISQLVNIYGKLKNRLGGTIKYDVINFNPNDVNTKEKLISEIKKHLIDYPSMKTDDGVSISNKADDHSAYIPVFIAEGIYYLIL